MRYEENKIQHGRPYAMEKQARRIPKAWRSVIEAIKGQFGGSPGRSMIRHMQAANLTPQTTLPALREAMSELVAITRNRGIQTPGEMSEALASVFRKSQTGAVSLSEIRDIYPALHRELLSKFRTLRPVRGGARAIDAAGTDYLYGMREPRATAAHYSQYILDRVLNSLALAKMDRRIKARLYLPTPAVPGNTAVPFERANRSAIRKWLIDAVMRGEIRPELASVPRSREEALSLARKVYLQMQQRGTTGTAVWDHNPDLIPVINLEVLTGKGGKPYVNTDLLKHEFGHILDLHGTRTSALREAKLSSGMNTNLASLPFEVTANRVAGLPEVTPWTDTYAAGSANPRLIRQMWRKYRYVKKPQLPQ